MTPAETPDRTARETDETADRLLALMTEVVTELHPQGAGTVSLDSRLDRDLGLDSLARVELLARIEQAFGTALPETIFADAETPRDLLRAIGTAPASVPRDTAAQPAAKLPADGAAGRINPPAHAEILNDVLAWHAEHHPDHPHIRLYGDDKDGEIITYRALAEEARAVAAGLVNLDIQPGQTVAIMLPTGRDYFTCFYGILLAGAIPVPVYPPARLSQIEEHLKRHIAILQNCEAAALITIPEAAGIAQLLRAHVEPLKHIVTSESLTHAHGAFTTPAVKSSDIAFLQYTSGSTGAPKGVVLSHANLLANIRAYGSSIDIRPDDVCVSWLPLYHDMGLIGAWFGSLYYGVPLILMSPLTFLARPQRWLQAIHRYKGTISAGPNFAYELCARRIQDKDIEGLDLSSWRIAMNGAEAISPTTLERFCKRFAAYGFDRRAMMPVYGLAESSVALAFPPLRRGPVIDRIRREPFMDTGRALPAEPDDANVRTFVACGHPLPGHQIRIVDAAGHELPDRREGRLQFKGPSATSGYYRNSEKTRELFDHDWLESGDRAYIADGDVYITGRNKDVIIKGGRNIYPDELEDAIGNLSGIGKDAVAVFGMTDPQSGTERLIVVAESRRWDSDAADSLRAEINALAADMIGMPADEVMLAPPRSVPKTSSGKIRRSSTRELYEQKAIGRPQRGARMQIFRLALTSLKPALRRAGRLGLSSLYAVYFWTVLGIISTLTWFTVVAMPVARWRWPVMRAAISLLRRCLAIGYSVQGLDNLPADGHAGVIVSNHASYLDSLILIEALPFPVSFVAKGELKKQPIARLFLERIRTEFVERFDRDQSVQDAKRIAQSVRGGRTVLFYPEGTCQRMPGLLPFHLGAFMAAAEANLPVVPVTLRGSRAVLRPDTWFPHRGRISIFIGKPVYPQTTDDIWNEAVRLRDTVRADILRRCGEPDLGRERILV
ncbi:MAG: AMP-binding protein [Rhodospirillales bacterium]